MHTQKHIAPSFSGVQVLIWQFYSTLPCTVSPDPSNYKSFHIPLTGIWLRHGWNSFFHLQLSNRNLEVLCKIGIREYIHDSLDHDYRPSPNSKRSSLIAWCLFACVHESALPWCIFWQLCSHCSHGDAATSMLHRGYSIPWMTRLLAFVLNTAFLFII